MSDAGPSWSTSHARQSFCIYFQLNVVLDLVLEDNGLESQIYVLHSTPGTECELESKGRIENRIEKNTEYIHTRPEVQKLSRPSDSNNGGVYFDICPGTGTPYLAVQYTVVPPSPLR